jgi:hypothetical protein
MGALQTTTTAAPNAGGKATATAPAPSNAPTPAPVPTDPAVLGLMPRLVDRMDAMASNQAVLAKDNGDILQRLAEQAEQNRLQQQEIERLRAQTAIPSGRREVKPVETASVPTDSPSFQASRFYGVAKGRTVGVFIRSKEAERSVKGYSGAMHKRFRTEAAARSWIRERGHQESGADYASDLSADASQFDSRTIYEAPAGPDRVYGRTTYEQPDGAELSPML